MRRLACLFLVVVSGCIGLPKYASPSVPEPVEAFIDHLAFAADCLDRGDTTAAIPHLADHVRLNPDHVLIRSLLAEQLLKLGKYADAGIEFERVADTYCNDLATHRESLVQCHTRLMQIAQERGNEFEESFHRGAGLLLMVEGWNPKVQDANLTERTLSQALTNLRDAAEKNPNDARTQLLLGDLLSRMGQHGAAKSAYRKANSCEHVGFTSAERERLCENCK